MAYPVFCVSCIQAQRCSALRDTTSNLYATMRQTGSWCPYAKNIIAAQQASMGYLDADLQRGIGLTIYRSSLPPFN